MYFENPSFRRSTSSTAGVSALMTIHPYVCLSVHAFVRQILTPFNRLYNSPVSQSVSLAIRALLIHTFVSLGMHCVDLHAYQSFRLSVSLSAIIY